MYKENFSRRHIGPSTSELNSMLETIGVNSIEDLLSQTIPDKIRLKTDLNIPNAISEMKFQLRNFKPLKFRFPTHRPPYNSTYLAGTSCSSSWYKF